MTNMEKVCRHLAPDELLCQLAEEAAELSKAALKLRRTIVTTNPTPMTGSEAFDSVIEEVIDVEMVLDVLDFYWTEGGVNDRRAEQVASKFARWADRLEGRHD